MSESFLNRIPAEILEHNLKERKRFEKANLMILNRIFKICLNKSLQFEVQPKLDLVSVISEDFSFNYSAYYKGELSNYQGSHSVKIDNLLELVKKYKV
jgi:hypothetical protein